MPLNYWEAKASSYLQRLCVEIPNRRVGSAGNRAATDLFAAAVRACGFGVEMPEFDCVDWCEEGVSLVSAGDDFQAYASPYSLGCHLSAPLVAVSNLEELAAGAVQDAILLLRGEIAREQLMPKHFPFYNPEGHQRIIQALEARNPRAIIAATTRDESMVGGQYPFPLFEDGDFDIPSVYMTDVEGERLAERVGEVITLVSRARRIPSHGRNVVARKGPAGRRVVFLAHIDSRIGTPGAGDNASGVIVLLLLAELLADYGGELGVELVAMNGEDYYANPGEQLFLAANAGRFDEIVLGINLDDVGYVRGRIAYSLYDVPPQLERVVRGVVTGRAGLIEGPSWYQGDHGILLMNGVPAVAFTSELLEELMREITHTPRDRPEMVDPAKLALLALALRDLTAALDRPLG